MKSWLAIGFLFLATPGGARAQDSVSDLTVTLPNGKVVTFQTEEQKARYMSARAAQANRLQQVAASPTAQPSPSASGAAPFTTEDKPVLNGKVNATAPTFTAAYYMIAPETWAGKQITLSVAFLEPVRTKQPREDGLQQLEALTYNNTQGGTFGQSSGGYLAVLAKPETAARLIQLCGTTYQFNGAQYRTTLIRGELRKTEKLSRHYSGYSSMTEPDDYAFYVEK